MDFPKIEKEILKFWQENKIFEKLRQKNKGKKQWSFLDGPITANNPMGVHHAWGRTYKDLFQRYKAMQGFDERFQNGFDCQGLWVEVEVEKELGFKNKKDIEKYGIEKFVERCKERVRKYSKIQMEQSIRLGQWMDWDNSYYTMSDENNYAIWYFLKKCQEKELLYKGRDVVPWCPRCGTAISQHEILTEEYKEIVHKAIFFKLPVIGQKDTYFLGWTTTPWTLPANVALAVHPELDYAIVKSKIKNQNAKLQIKNQKLNEEKIILLKNKINVLGDDYEVVKTIKGKELENMEYEGLFDELPAVREGIGKFEHSVVLWKDVTSEEGTGIVHIAPGCGQEDFQLSRELGLPVIDPTNDESCYKEGFGNLSGKFVFEDETRDLIFESLRGKNLVFKIEDYKHRYPTCWRCKTELIFRLVNEWYISMEELRGPLKETTKKIKWFPSFGQDRELDWLNNMQDWLISKKRYWGLALPIFECQKCGNFEVIGSKEELKERAVEGWDEFAAPLKRGEPRLRREGHSPHRPWIDKIKIRCQRCGSLLSRILDVGNPWLDAGIVPFSTTGYFQDRGYWRKWFPADFICESFPGQFKNWFYVLLVMSQVLEDTNPFKTVLGYATVVDEKGEEMHKSKGNAIWFDEAVEKIGADVMRWMYSKQNPVFNMKLGYNIAKETKRKLLTLWNSYTFFETYVSKKEIPNPKSQSTSWRTNKFQIPNSKNILDQWIISKLNRLIGVVTESLDKYDAARASKAIEDFFVDDLSLWYIRRSRKRFQNPKKETEKQEAVETLYFVLLTLTKLFSPMMPFLAEEVYQKLKDEEMPQSVHLCDWPKIIEKAVNQELENQMDSIREIITKTLAKRTELGIKVRQPLPKLKIKNALFKPVGLTSPSREKLKITEELLDLIKEEVNVKEIVFDDKIKEEIELDVKITEELKEEGVVREIIRHIQDLRRIAGLTPKNKALIIYMASLDISKVLEKNKDFILKTTRAVEIKRVESKKEKFDKEKTMKVASQEFWLAIKKVE